MSYRKGVSDEDDGSGMFVVVLNEGLNCQEDELSNKGKVKNMDMLADRGTFRISLERY